MALKIRLWLPSMHALPHTPDPKRVRARARNVAICVPALLFLFFALCVLPRAAASSGPPVFINPELNVNYDENTGTYFRRDDFKNSEPQKWVFIRFPNLDKRIVIWVKSANSEKLDLDKLTEDPSKQVEPNKWYGFLGDVPLELSVQPGAEKNGSLEMDVDQCQPADLAERARKSEASVAVNNCKGEQIAIKKVKVSWHREPLMTDDPLLLIGKWAGIVLIALVIIYIMLRFTGVFRIIGRWIDEGKLTSGKKKDEVFTAPEGSQQDRSSQSVGPGVVDISRDSRSRVADEVMQKLADRLNTLEGELSRQIRENKGLDGEQLRATINDRLSRLESDISQHQNNVTQRVTGLDKKLDSLEDIGKRTANQQGQYHEKYVKDKAEADEVLRAQVNALLAQSSSRADRLQASLDSVKDTVAGLREPDMASAKALGMVLGESVDGLREDGFAELAGAVNRFFRERITKDGDKLLELNIRVEELDKAMRSLLRESQQSDSLPAEQLTPYVERVGRVVSELGELCSQIKRKQLTLLATNLHVPVSAHENARYTFLEELGLAIKREIEKLRDPLAYFERQIEGLATSEIIAIADICDKKTGLPPRDSKLEEILSSLFAQTGLIPILPASEGEFKTVDQELVGTVSVVNPESRMKIARVVYRGFYFQQNGSEQNSSERLLIRKAGVEVYG